MTFSAHPTVCLYQHFWQPARFAHPDWLAHLGIKQWNYGQHPALDAALNQMLRARLGAPYIRLSSQLSDDQLRVVTLARQMNRLLIAIGLVQLGCSDYLLLPDYRAVLQPTLSDSAIWQLFGLCRSVQRAHFSPHALIDNAREIGIATLHRAALRDPFWFAFLITVPPPRRALWPVVPKALPLIVESVL